MPQESYASTIWKPEEKSDFLPRQQRRDCVLVARLVMDGRQAHCVVRNISLGGVGIKIDPIIKLRAGQTLNLSCDALGSIACAVRWCSHPSYGLEFDERGKISPKVREYFDTLTPANG